ncbi:MAG: hypothetical protein Q4Q31_10300 [Bacillota bacterium]|nr:hypothetical protein [Bacillota bacterium]
MDYILFIIWLIFMILAHYLFKNEINYLKRKLSILFNYSPYFKEYDKKILKTFLYTSFTLIVGNTFEHLDLWVDFFFVSIWFIFDEKENITIENKKETIPSLIGIVLGLLIQYFI